MIPVTFSQLAEAIGGGLALAAAFNPIIALIGAAAAAAIVSVGRGYRRTFAAVSTLLAFWLVGDGLRVLARGRDLADGLGGSVGWPAWLSVALWGAGGLLLGYALPAWAGAFVGRRVVIGTGWLTAITVSVGVSLAVAALAALGT